MEFCYRTATVWQMVGKFLFILKILIPIVIIVLGTIDFGKSVISNDDKAIMNSSKKLLNKILIGIAIFFVPLIINIVFGMIGSFSEEMKNDYVNCVSCLTDPYNNCDTSYQGEIFKNN